MPGGEGGVQGVDERKVKIGPKGGVEGRRKEMGWHRGVGVELMYMEERWLRRAVWQWGNHVGALLCMWWDVDREYLYICTYIVLV